MISSDCSLRDQTALITGSASGIGLRMAQVLAELGAHVVLVGRIVEGLERAVAAIRLTGASASFVVSDLAMPGSPRQLAREVCDQFGTPGILVNNAGCGFIGPAIECSDDQLSQMISLNLQTPFVLSCQIADRLIAEKRSGRIINVASMSAFNCNPRHPASMYGATKAAIVRLTEALATEWAAAHINVNAIAPGFIQTEMTQSMIDAAGFERVSEKQTRGRIMEPTHLDSTLVYLVSPYSAAVTGTCIKVDDGQLPR